MAVTENTGGTQTATINTEHTLATITSAGTYLLQVDTANMVGGDTLELRIYSKVRTGGTSQVLYYAAYVNAQTDLNKISPPVPTVVEFKATLKQTTGTGRNFIWSVYAL